MRQDRSRPERDAAAELAGALPDLLDGLSTGSSGATGDLAPALDALRAAGVLTAVLPAPEGCALGTARGTARPLSDMLRALGAADLSLARLVEGHVNAALLVETHGAPATRAAMRDAVRSGALLGVWGADGPAPLTVRTLPDGRLRLQGAKRFASGLGHVATALVTAREGADGPQRMLLMPADDPARHRPGDWTASALRATRSGGFDASGLTLPPEAAIGGPGDLAVEPWFEGGVWRYCAAHVGGAEGLIARWTALLERMGRLSDPVQRDRLGRATAEAVAARAVVEAAAEAVEGASEAGGDREAVARAVAHALFAREAVEAACARILALSERALGMAAQDAAGDVDGHRRDLSLFLRQAAPDAKLDRALAVSTACGPGALR
jgi:alkylation response protein AidB-like acyl-CoA dehydrogenase